VTQDSDFEALLKHLARARGFDFTAYKRASLMRRVRKRMQEVGVEGFSEYVDYLEVNPDEFEALFNTILINVTAFFRDREAWNGLESDIVPRLIAGSRKGGGLRVWSAGCASGQEAYSAAMLFAEALGPEEFTRRLKIYATDVDEEALREARQGSYDQKQVESVPEGLLEKYFEPDDGRFVFRKDLRRAVIFGRNDLVQDSPISRIDLLLCRNSLMYFHAETQERIIARFHFALNPRGVLFLGKSEMLTRHGELFSSLNPDDRLFEKVPVAAAHPALPQIAEGGADAADVAVREHMRVAAADAAPVAQVVVDADDVVVAVNREARSLFDLGEGDVGRLLQDLELSYRPVELRSAVDLIRREPQTVSLGEAKWTKAGGETRQLEVRLAPVLANGAVEGVSIVFNDVTRFHTLEEALANTKSDAETAYEELQSTAEELETTNEELQSTNEELETTNEELQSTNEELETTNEELQSTNAEVATVNDQLRKRTTEVDSAIRFLDGILTSLPSGVVVVDHDLTVLMWNRRSEDLWGLRAEEVHGQHLLNLDIGLPVDELKDPIRAALGGDSPTGPVELSAINRRGRPVEVRATCSLLATAQGVDGVVVMLDVLEKDGA
jgi:two-component system, chemotaxis family, CheB/CheR fusion protein